MIQAEELRLGNFVNHTGFNVFWEVAEIKAERVLLLEMYGNGLMWQLVQDVKPIPLTQDWLLKLGFEKIEGPNNIYTIATVKSNLEKLVVFRVNHGEYGFGFANYYSGKEKAEPLMHHINNVHSLQNLYFTLTGAELTLQAPDGR